MPGQGHTGRHSVPAELRDQPGIAGCNGIKDIADKDPRDGACRALDLIGVGVGKAGDVIGAVRKGVADGKKHLVKVPLTRANSIPTISTGRDGAASVLMRPAAPGTGVIAGGSIRTVLELAGIKNVLAKRLGSKTPLNNARAALVALRELRTHKDTAKERGITLEQIYS